VCMDFRHIRCVDAGVYGVVRAVIGSFQGHSGGLEMCTGHLEG